MLAVGERIKNMREQKGLTLQQLADKVEFTTAILNQIENHLLSPPLGVLLKLARAMDAQVGELWGEHGGEPFIITRNGDGRTVSRFASKEGTNYGYTYNSLGSGKANRNIEPFIITLEPPTVKPLPPSSHDGEEFLYVVSGMVEVSLDGHADVLEAGDSIQYDARVPHRVTCYGGEPATMVAVVWSPEKAR